MKPPLINSVFFIVGRSEIEDWQLGWFLIRANQRAGFEWYQRTFGDDKALIADIYMELASRGLVILKHRRPRVTQKGQDLLETFNGEAGPFEDAPDIGRAIKALPVDIDVPDWRISEARMTLARWHWIFEAFSWYLIPLGIVGLIIWGLVWVFRTLMSWG